MTLAIIGNDTPLEAATQKANATHATQRTSLFSKRKQKKADSKTANATPPQAPQPTDNTPPTIATKLDSVSLAIGIINGTSFADNLKTFPGGSPNHEVMLYAFNNAFKGEKLAMDIDQAQAYLQNFLMEANNNTQAMRIEANKNYLEANKSKRGVIETKSGLQYRIIKEGKGDTPSARDKVKVSYRGTLIDGTEFDNSEKHGGAITFVVDQVVDGWSEGLRLMSPGSKYSFVIPPKLGYGAKGAGKIIPPHTILCFEIELLEINPEE